MCKKWETAILLLVALTQVAQADPLDTWILRHPLPTQIPLRSVVCGGGEFVAVGDGIIVSADGLTWSPAKSGATNSLAALAYGNGRFVAVGAGGTVLTSTNGLDWAPDISPTGGDLSAIAFGGGQFVAAAQEVNPTTQQWEGAVWTSEDGVNWVRRQSATSYTVSSITFDNNRFVAVGWDYSLQTDAILTSGDGVNWTEYHSETMPGTQFILNSIAYGNGKFVAVGACTSDNCGTNVLVSSDGAHWNQATAAAGGEFLLAVAYGNGIFVAADETGTIVTSSDGLNWAVQRTGRGGGLAGLAYGANQFVAVGELGGIVASTDGMVWTQRQPPTPNGLTSIAYGNTRFVAGGDLGTAFRPVGLTSVDGANWFNEEIQAAFPGSCIVFYEKGLFLALTGDKYGLPVSSISFSTNGVDWTVANPWIVAVVNGIAYGDGKFLAAGGWEVLTSPDAINWEVHTGGIELPLDAVTYGNQQFVGVSRQGFIAASADGVTWTASHKTTNSIQSVVYGNGRFVAVGQAGTVLSSANGLDWVLGNSPVGSDLTAIAYGAGQFVAVGQAGTILTSIDGMTWAERRSGTQFDLYAAAFGNGHFVVVGQHGAILQSGTILNVALEQKPDRNSLALSVIGPPGSAYNVEMSTNLISWRNLTNLTANENGEAFLEVLPSSSEHVFYRATSP
jgi:hypothetical protein